MNTKQMFPERGSAFWWTGFTALIASGTIFILFVSLMFESVHIFKAEGVSFLWGGDWFAAGQAIGRHSSVNSQRNLACRHHADSPPRRISRLPSCYHRQLLSSDTLMESIRNFRPEYHCRASTQGLKGSSQPATHSSRGRWSRKL